MAIKKVGTKFNEQHNEWFEQWEADYEHDLSDLPRCNPGSTCLVKETGKTVTVGNTGAWGGGSSSGGGVFVLTIKDRLDENGDWLPAEVSHTFEEVLQAMRDGVAILVVRSSPFTYEVFSNVYGSCGEDDPHISWGEGSRYDANGLSA